MAFVPSENRLGVKAFTNIDTATAVPFGTVIRGQDSASGNGAGEFIYLPGVASTKPGSLVTYQSKNAKTTLAPSTANQSAYVAVAMATVATTTNFGWYQIQGAAKVLKTAVKVSPGSKIWISGTAGRVFATATSGKQIVGAISVDAATVASATSTIFVQLNRPFAQGQII